jgi:hypothetical protein
MKKTEQLKLIDLETPREAAERRHREYVARFRQEQQEARQNGLRARHREKLRRTRQPEHGISDTLSFGW